MMGLSIKTVWHFKNLLKGCCVLVAVIFVWSCYIVDLLNLTAGANMLLSLVVGVVSTLIIMSKWEMWHFE